MFLNSAVYAGQLVQHVNLVIAIGGVHGQRTAVINNIIILFINQVGIAILPA